MVFDTWSALAAAFKREEWDDAYILSINRSLEFLHTGDLARENAVVADYTGEVTMAEELMPIGVSMTLRRVTPDGWVFAIGNCESDPADLAHAMCEAYVKYRASGRA